MKRETIIEKYPTFYKYYTLLSYYRSGTTFDLLEIIPEQFIEVLELEIRYGNIKVDVPVTIRTAHYWDNELEKFIEREDS